MPYPGIPKNKEKEMERCVQQVMDSGKSKDSAVAICHSSIIGSKKSEFNMNQSNFYIPFTKKDEEQRMVWGYASTESLDSQGEIIKREAIIKALPNYMKFANIREMHQPSAVGKTKEATVDGNGLYIGVKVVDDSAWKKCVEGVYNGFSIGGRIVTKIGNEIIDLVLSEISLVDRPACPDAVFSVVKAEDLRAVKKEDMGMEMPEMEDKEEPEEDETESPGEKVGDFLEDQVSIFDVSRIIEIVQQVIWAIADRMYAGKDTSDLEMSLESLKAALKSTLADGQEMADKIDGLVSLIKSHKDSDQNDFAYVDKNGNKALPFTNKDALSNSINRFSSINFESVNHKILAAKILKSAADKNELVIKNSHLLDFANREIAIDINKNYALDNEAYFSVMKMAMG